MPCVLAVDQSTSATKALLLDESGRCLDRESREHRQQYPKPGWVEHDAEEIWQNVLATARALMARSPQRLADLVCLSLVNQRETVVVFERASGRPLYPAIVWQCRRSTELCAQHEAEGHGPLLHARTGLHLDAYFSASKLQWLVRNEPDLRRKLESGEAAIGTMDTYLIYRLTGGRVFATEPTNASRTLLFDIRNLAWDPELCSLWEVPLQALPELRDSDARFGDTTLEGTLSRPLPIVGVMGDSQASLFAQGCFEPGQAKVTFGTGSSVLVNIGQKPLLSERGVVTALAWVRGGEPAYAFEGIVIHSAATLNWLINQMALARDVAELEALAAQTPDCGGVYLVPAFSGLGLPDWEPQARGALVGLSGHSDRRHVARAAFESIAFQLRDALDAMQAESPVVVRSLRADGGPTNSSLLMQLTADLTQTELVVSSGPAGSALGAAQMGLLGLGVHGSLASISHPQSSATDSVFRPTMPPATVQAQHAGWRRAVGQVLSGVASTHSRGD